MSQTKVKDYFSTKKRIDSDQHPAKRRKVESSSALSIISSEGDKPEEKQREQVMPQIEVSSESSGFVTNSFSLQSGSARRGRSMQQNKSVSVNQLSSKPAQRKRSRGSKCGSVRVNSQPKLTDLFKSQGNNDLDQVLESSDSKFKDTNSNTSCNADDTDECLGSAVINDKSFVSIIEEVTSIQDDHDREAVAEKAGLHTPRKRTSDVVEKSSSKTRKSKTAARKLRQSMCLEEDTSLVLAKKKLNLVEDNGDDCKNKVKETESEESTQEIESKPKESLERQSGDKESLLAMVSDLAQQPLALSPVPGTPERKDSPEPDDVVKPSPKLRDLSEKLKVLSKMNGQALKNRLKQSGKLKELKEKTQELKSTLDKQTAASSTSLAAQESRDKQSSLPAYQRFDHLAAEGTPTLALPFSYRLVENTFQAMDTVVSMMNNRSEMCTFSKLKVAVQNITKKNFEERSVGQIKTVMPDAYTFRQETNVPAFGKKKSNAYQLTVEPNLPEEEHTNVKIQRNKDGKPLLSASILLNRKKCFKNSLIARVKEIHKTFLASLNPPLYVPDDKLTRWHPKFQLDKVAEIPAASLPQPPETMVYQSAKDVLESRRGKFSNPKVEEALSRVALDSAESNNNTSKKDLEESPTVSTPPAAVTTSSLKGIPPALLAKIRAKEAQKMQQALTRDPVEDNKTKMMGHLPEIIRILRSYFVTEKKPALPLDAVYKKLEDSYRSGISRRDVEHHVHLLKELAPELVSVVEIKQGKYLKLDKNANVQDIANRIMNLVKSRQ